MRVNIRRPTLHLITLYHPSFPTQSIHSFPSTFHLPSSFIHLYPFCHPVTSLTHLNQLNLIHLNQSIPIHFNRTHSIPLPHPPLPITYQLSLSAHSLIGLTQPIQPTSHAHTSIPILVSSYIYASLSTHLYTYHLHTPPIYYLPLPLTNAHAHTHNYTATYTPAKPNQLD